jgi:hypothetical protein
VTIQTFLFENRVFKYVLCCKNLPNNVELLSKPEEPNFASFDEGATTSQTDSRDWLSLISELHTNKGQRRTALKE